MNNLQQIEKLLEELSEYHMIFGGRVAVIHSKIYMVDSLVRKGNDPQEKNNLLIEKLNLLKNHFQKDCYSNPRPFLEEFVQDAMQIYAPFESLVNHYCAGVQNGNFSGLLGNLDDSVTDFAGKSTSVHIKKFLTVIWDALRIYDEKGGSSNDLYKKIEQSVEAPFQDSHAKMIFDAITKGREFVPKEKEYLERTRELYPEFLK